MPTKTFKESFPHTQPNLTLKLGSHFYYDVKCDINDQLCVNGVAISGNLTTTPEQFCHPPKNRCSPVCQTKQMLFKLAAAKQKKA